ncbi:MAG: T9SS type A sorting domain-containing protein [Flavobacteriales bacterium]|nr:T9SS type A sorting domain-containing protein [Flavobacteriales bacterium]
MKEYLPREFIHLKNTNLSTMRIYPCLLIVTSMLFSAALHAQILQENWWQTNGPVKAMAVDSVKNVLYIGGHFDYAGPPQESLAGSAIIRSSNGDELPFAARPNGPINTVVSDGHGGWYIGGSFTQVGDQVRRGLARIDSIGNVLPFFENMTSSWEPLIPNTGSAGIPQDLALQNDKLYMGGIFDRIGPMHLCSGVVNSSMGEVFSASASANATVLSSVPDGTGGWYIGGEFTEVGGEERIGLARLNADGSLNGWNPGTNGKVKSMALRGNTLYLLGGFTNVAGSIRQHLAAIDVTTGLAKNWDPGIDNTNGVLCVSGSTLYVAGPFLTVAGVSRNGFASFDLTNGLITPWSPIALVRGKVSAMVATEGKVYIGGNFTFGTSFPAAWLAKMDGTTGQLETWAPGLRSSVNTLAIVGANLLVGGEFNAVNLNTEQHYLTQYDLSTGLAVPWTTGNYPDGPVDALAVQGSTIYAAGRFNLAGGQVRHGLVALNVSDGTASEWAPVGTSDGVHTLSTDGMAVYIGGLFTNLGGTYQRNIVALQASTGALVPWNMDVPDRVTQVEVDGNSVYFSGPFKFVNGEPKKYLAKADGETGELLPFDPKLSGSNVGINELLVSDGMVFVSGNFTKVGGVANSGFAAYNANGNYMPELALGNNGSVFSLKKVGGTLFLGGAFTSVRTGTLRGRGAALDVATGALKPWNPDADNLIKDLDYRSGRIYAAGDFTLCGGADRARFAAMDTVAGIATDWTCNVDRSATLIVNSGPRMYIAGLFTNTGGLVRRNMAAFDISAGTPTAWNPDANWDVISLFVNNNTVFAGGGFTTVAGLPHSGVVAVNGDSGQPRSWAPVLEGGGGAAGYVRAFAVRNDRLYVGGFFTGVNGEARMNTAAFSLQTGELLPWNVSAIGSYISSIWTVNALAIKGNYLLLGGNFSEVQGESRNNLAAVNATTGVLLPWSPALNNSISDLIVDGNRLFASGMFSTVNGNPHQSLASFNLSTGLENDWEPEVGSLNPNVNAIAKKGSMLFGAGKVAGTTGDASIRAWNSATGASENYQFAGIPGYTGRCISTTGDLLFLGEGLSYSYVFGGLYVYSLTDPQLRSSKEAPERDPHAILISPNPANAGAVRLYWSGAEEARNALVSVYSTDGRMLMEHPVSVSDGRVETLLDLPKGTAPGLYLVRVVAGERSGTARLAVERAE